MNKPNKSKDLVKTKDTKDKKKGFKITTPKGGRPPRYTPDTLIEAIEDYFEMNETYTFTGLELHLFDYRTGSGGLSGYERDERYSRIIAKAKSTIKAHIQERMINGQGSAPGIIFWAKNNMGYADKQEVVTRHDLVGDFAAKIGQLKDAKPSNQQGEDIIIELPPEIETQS